MGYMRNTWGPLNTWYGRGKAEDAVKHTGEDRNKDHTFSEVINQNKEVPKKTLR